MAKKIKINPKGILGAVSKRKKKMQDMLDEIDNKPGGKKVKPGKKKSRMKKVDTTKYE